jgi:hypothetical protein
VPGSQNHERDVRYINNKILSFSMGDRYVRANQADIAFADAATYMDCIGERVQMSISARASAHSKAVQAYRVIDAAVAACEGSESIEDDYLVERLSKAIPVKGDKAEKLKEFQNSFQRVVVAKNTDDQKAVDIVKRTLDRLVG